MKKEIKQILFKVDKDTYDEFKKNVEKEDSDMSKVLRRCISVYNEKNRKNNASL